MDVPVPDGHQPEIIKLLPTDFDIVYTSPLIRCKLLAEQISSTATSDTRLMELHFGDWEGMKWDDIDRMALDIWGENYIDSPPPNGESLLDLLGRLQSFIQELSELSYKKVIIVTHGGIIRCAMHLFNDIPLHQVMMEKVDFGGIYTFKL